MTRLIKEEFIKIVKRKFTLMLLILFGLFNIFNLLSYVFSENCIENGQTIVGINAIEKNKEIMQKYSGVLTDETIHNILNEYGTTSHNKGNGTYNYNNANSYATYAFTDYIRILKSTPDSSTNVSIPSEEEIVKTIPEVLPYASDTETPIFGYSHGWFALADSLTKIKIMTLIIIIASIIPIFSEEYSRKTDSLILTARYGKTKVITAKIVSALIFSLILYIVISLFNFLMTGAIWGFGGLENSIQCSGTSYLSMGRIMPWGEYFTITFLLYFVSTVTVTIIVILISSIFSSQLTAIVISATVVFIPVVAYMASGMSLAIQKAASLTPIMACIDGSYINSITNMDFSIGYVPIFIISVTVVSVISIYISGYVFKNRQAG